MLQILIEAVVLAVVGGAMGVGLGAVVTAALGRVFDLSLHITAGLRGAGAGGFEHRGHRFGLVSGRARGAARSGGGAACGVNREHQLRGKTSQWPSQAVWTHRFRSLLTILGIVIGITTVVTVASLLTGLRQGVVTFFQELGPDNIFVFRTSGDPGHGPIRPRSASAAPLKPEYADTVKRWCTALADVGLVLYVPPVVDGNPITARVPGSNPRTST